MNLRQVHRWIATIGMVLLAYVAITGTVLTTEELLTQSYRQEQRGPGGPTPPPTPPADAAPLPDAATLSPLVLQQLRDVLAAHPGAAPETLRVQIAMRSNQPSIRISLDDSDVERGSAQAGGPPPGQGREAGFWSRPLNAQLQALHGGGILGLTGEWIILITGVFFCVLSITGIILFFRMLAARRRIGRREWFWN